MTKKKLAELSVEMTANSSKLRTEFQKGQAASRALRKDFKKTQNANELLRDSFRRVANVSSILTGPFGEISSRLSFISTGIGSFGAATTLLGVGSSAVVATLGLSTAAFARYERGLMRTESLVRSTGFTAGKSAEEIEHLARSVAAATLGGVDEARQAANILQTFRSISGDTFDKSLYLAHDLAEVMGGDVKSATMQLAKALEDPVKGVSALARSGVSFNDAQKESIKLMMETGRQAQAQALILKTLEQQVGGAGSAAAGGLTGSVDTLSQRWQEFLEGLGETSGIADATKSVLDRLHRGINARNKELFNYGESRSQGIARIAKTIKQIRAELDRDDILISPNREKNLLQQERRLFAQLRALNEKTMEEGRVAYDGAKRQREEEEASKQAGLKKQQAESSKQFMLLKKGLASQADLVADNYENRKQQIEDLVLSETEINKAGFDSLEDLQVFHLKRNEQVRDEQLRKIKQANTQEVDAEKRKQAQLHQLQFRTFARLRSLYESDEQRLSRQYIDQLSQIETLTLTEQQIKATGFENIEALKSHYRTLAELQHEKDMRDIAERNEGELEAERKKYEEKQKLVQGFWANMKDHVADSSSNFDAMWGQTFDRFALGIGDATASAIMEGQSFGDTMRTITRSAITEVISGLVQIGVKRLALWALERTIGAGSQAASIAQAAITGSSIAAAMAPAAAMTSLATAGGNSAGAIAGITATTTTAKMLSMVGMAHDGIDEIPKEGTWLLDKGERVVDQRTNGDLKAFLQNQAPEPTATQSINITLAPTIYGDPSDSMNQWYLQNRNKILRDVGGAVKAGRRI